LGILNNDPKLFFKGIPHRLTLETGEYKIKGSEAHLIHAKGISITEVYIDEKIQVRVDAKKSKNWAIADQIRNEL
jgi:cysteinyl-tRNA synthetase